MQKCAMQTCKNARCKIQHVECRVWSQDNLRHAMVTRRLATRNGHKTTRDTKWSQVDSRHEMASRQLATRNGQDDSQHEKVPYAPAKSFIIRPPKTPPQTDITNKHCCANHPYLATKWSQDGSRHEMVTRRLATRNGHKTTRDTKWSQVDSRHEMFTRRLATRNGHKTTRDMKWSQDDSRHEMVTRRLATRNN